MRPSTVADARKGRHVLTTFTLCFLYLLQVSQNGNVMRVTSAEDVYPELAICNIDMSKVRMMCKHVNNFVVIHKSYGLYIPLALWHLIASCVEGEWVRFSRSLEPYVYGVIIAVAQNTFAAMPSVIDVEQYMTRPVGAFNVHDPDPDTESDTESDTDISSVLAP